MHSELKLTAKIQLYILKSCHYISWGIFTMNFSGMDNSLHCENEGQEDVLKLLRC
jgi:propanediol dehydratase large subunit